MDAHLSTASDRLIRDQEQRHAWLADAAAKIKRWRAEDAANGEPWDTHPINEGE